MMQYGPVSGNISATDRLLLDEEHARLEQFMNDMSDICENFFLHGNCLACNRSQVATCQGRLTSFFYDFLDLVAEHFENEENILRSSLTGGDGDERFFQHKNEHARLMHEINDLMRESLLLSHQGNPSAAIRRLDQKITEMFGAHANVFDAPILLLTQKDGDE